MRLYKTIKALYGLQGVVEWLCGRGRLNGYRPNLRYADLRSADMRYADLRNADLRYVDLRSADLSGANLSGANLRYADLSDADLDNADLRYVDLRNANLDNADLRNADLSGVKGLLSDIDFMNENFEKNKKGWIVYKKIGNTDYSQPAEWIIKKGSILTEVCNPNRQNECGCGVNFGNLKWCKVYYSDAVLWECLIRWEWCSSIIVPYNTDGNARCEKLELVKIVEDKQNEKTV